MQESTAVLSPLMRTSPLFLIRAWSFCILENTLTWLLQVKVSPYIESAARLLFPSVSLLLMTENSIAL